MCFLGANFCIILPTYKSFSKYRHSTVGSISRGSLVPRELPVCALTRGLFHYDSGLLYIRAAEGEHEKGRVGDERGGKRKQENRTQNSICSGLDGSFFSLKREALNPICASCQLCPRVPWGGRKVANG